MRFLYALPFLLPTAALGQTSDAFEARMDEILDGAGEESDLVRCAGLMRAVFVVAPEGSPLAALAEDIESDLAFLAVTLILENAPQETEPVVLAVTEDVTEIGAEYLDHFAANQERSGEIIDPETGEHLVACRDLRDQIVALAE